MLRINFLYIILIMFVSSCTKNNFIILDKKIFKLNESKEMLINYANRKMLHPFFGSHVSFKNLQFSIVIEDINNNNKIDFNIDKIHLGSIKDSFIYISEAISNSICPIEKSNIIRIDDTNIQIDVIDNLNKKIKLSKSNNTKFNAYYSDKIPNYNLINLISGEAINLSNFPKKKFTYIYFWGSWCEPCIAELPELKKIYEKYKEQLTIIGIDCKETNIEKVKLILRQHNIPWTNLISDNIINKYLHQNGFPFGALYINDKLEINKCNAKKLNSILHDINMK